MQIQLPETLGGRINQSDVRELFFQWLQRNGERLGLPVNKKATAIKILEAPFQFLLGEVGADRAEVPSIEEIVTNGGLLKYYETKITNGVHFKQEWFDGRFFKNPHPAAPEGSANMVHGRLYIKLSSQLIDGSSIPGVGTNKDDFQPYAEGEGGDVPQADAAAE